MSKPLTKLQGRIREMNTSYRECAEFLGISLNTFCEKINGKEGKDGKPKQFGSYQVVELCKFLKIPLEQAFIFFT